MISLLKFLALAPLMVGPLAVLPSTNALSLTGSNSNLNARAHHAAISRRRNGEAGGFEKIARSGHELAVKKKRSKHIKKRGGQVCRIKNDDGSFSVVSSSSSSSATSAPASTDTPVAASTTDTPAASSTPAPTSDAWTSSEAPAPASSSAAPPSVGGNPSGSGGSGLGLAWPNGGWDCPGHACIDQYKGQTASWAYDWHYQTLQCAIDAGLEYIPMMWGAKDAGQQFWDAAALWPSSVVNVLFFNEPNDGGQANIDPWSAVQYWRQYMSPLAAKGYKIGMAATTSAPSGLKWVQDFAAACPDCWAECSFVPLHYYDTDAGRFQKYIEDYHSGLPDSRPIWVTEYACQNFNGGAQCSWDETMAFHYSMNDYFKSSPIVERWAPFGAMRNMQGVNQDNALMNPDGTITGLGSYYAYSG